MDLYDNPWLQSISSSSTDAQLPGCLFLHVTASRQGDEDIRMCLEEGKLQLSGLLADGLGEGGAALSEGLLQEHGAVEVEAVKGEQAHLHLDVRHLHILALACAQHLPAARGAHLKSSHHCALSTTRSTSLCRILSLSKRKSRHMPHVRQQRDSPAHHSIADGLLTLSQGRKIPFQALGALQMCTEPIKRSCFQLEGDIAHTWLQQHRRCCVACQKWTIGSARALGHAM